jgi:hypothetical protein
MFRALNDIKSQGVLPDQAACAAAITRLDTEESAIIGTVISLPIPNTVHLYMSIRLPISAPVRVDIGGQLLLGEVRYCAPQADAYVCGVQIEHSLKNLQAALTSWYE